MNLQTTRSVATLATVAFASAEHFANVKKEERLGSLIRRDDYVRPAYRPANCPLIGTVDSNRTAFVVRLDDGIGQEFITIDQTADAASAILCAGDQVLVTLVEDAHIEDTVRGTFNFDKVDHIDQATMDKGQILRQAEYVNARNRLCKVSIYLIGEKSTTKMICVEEQA